MGDKPAVLVTRPEGQAIALCEALKELGFAAYSAPMLELSGLDSPNERQTEYLSRLDHYQHIIFISGNAVKYGMDWISRAWPEIPTSPKWYAIGDITAARLAEFTIEATSSGDTMTSEGLLENPAFKDVAGQRVLIVKGRGGRVSLGDGLGARGAQVDELDCYLRSCPAMAQGQLFRRFREWNIGLVLVSSGEGLENMVSLLSQQESSELMQVPLIVPSGRIAGIALDRGFQAVEIASSASDRAMLRAVEHWWQTQSGSGE